MRIPACLVLLILALAFPVHAEEDRKPLLGEVELGYRSVEVDGNSNKYREQVNLLDGVRLFNLDLDFTPRESNALDQLTLEASDLGGDPFSTVLLRARKAGRYELRAEYRTSDYFYQDDGYFYSAEGDLHTWDTRRKFFGLDFRYDVARWVTLRFGANRMDRNGGSQTTRSLDLEVYPLNRPVDQTASTYWIGADFHVGWADVTVEQRLATYTNRWLLGATDTSSVDPGTGFLANYEQAQVQDSDAPTTRIRFGGMPTERLSFSLGYARIDATAEYDVDGDWSGLDSQGDAYQTDLGNRGSVERVYDLLDVELAYGVLHNLELGIDAYRKSYDQSGSIDYLEEQTGGNGEGTYGIQGTLNNTLSLDAYRLFANWRPIRMLVLTAGAGKQTRDAFFELAGPEVTTERMVYRAGVRLNPNQLWDLQFDYETGSDDTPYTQASATDLDRAKVRLRLRPAKGLGLLLHFNDESRENTLSYELGKPTDDVPPATDVSLAKFDVTGWGISLDCSTFRAVDFSLGYTRNEIIADAHLVYVTGFTFVPEFDFFTTRDRSDYTADQDVMRGMLRAKLAKAWVVGISGVATRNRGTLPLDWDRYQAWVRWAHSSGVFVRLQAERYTLRESNPYAGPPDAPTPDVNDYDADLLTVALGYRF